MASRNAPPETRATPLQLVVNGKLEVVDADRATPLPLSVLRGRHVTTLEGLATGGVLHPVQRAFVDEQAAQCGYCLNGMIMTVKALLAHTPRPTDTQIRQALRHNLCRCGTHVEILRAVHRAAGQVA